MCAGSDVHPLGCYQMTAASVSVRGGSLATLSLDVHGGDHGINVTVPAALIIRVRV